MCDAACQRMSTMLPITRIASPHGPTENTLYVLHGILGSRRNWRTFARRITQQCPGWEVHTLDLPEHGDTEHQPGPHTLDKMVDTIAEHAAQGKPPTAILGHSFGGKVAASYAHRFGAHLKACVVVDSAPESAEESQADDGLVSRVIRTLDGCRGPFLERNDARTALRGSDVPEPIVAWLLTALKRDEHGWRWAFNLDAMAPLLGSYRATDLWALLERGGELPVPYTVVCAGREGRWTAHHLERLATLEAKQRVQHHLFHDAGHWIHVDEPDELLRVIADALNP